MSEPAPPSGVVRHGHFRYESGHHGDVWLELDLLASYPERLGAAARELARRLADQEADLVCGPLEGGAFVAQWVAAELGLRFGYTRRGAGGRYAAPDSPDLRGMRAIVVDDAVNAGAAVIATARELERRGCTVAALGAVMAGSHSGTRVGARLGVPYVYLHEIAGTLWEPAVCPLCARGVPAEG
ncbi:orotate phosphoribosyltransferase [Murinocardiopsis flavida]|uniref:Orotate phosphoribosyltransferase n=1 Tax=Murinocardiopsis flavida TaxID=645275 RepID=A0A2P8CGZ3_9ACTN|nr:phosphoribosyltransferase family protein [Murinocardiopsis flavida]PSK84196.1 orotate phosphoribosyltransferase [Murinocardiopsis flavida]